MTAVDGFVEEQHRRVVAEDTWPVGSVEYRPTRLTGGMTTAAAEQPATIAAWHQLARTRDPAGLDDLLADGCVFHSPAVHTPQVGKSLTTAYLSAAMVVLGPTLRYVDEWYAETSAVLQFEAEVEGLTVQGVDMIRWDETGKITSFTVMVRPHKGLEALMGAMLIELTRPPA